MMRADLRRCVLRALAFAALLAVLACEVEPASVGRLPCGTGDGPCTPPSEAAPESLLLGAGGTRQEPPGRARVVWLRDLGKRTAPCRTNKCTPTVDAVLVHDDGEVTYAGTLLEPDGDSLLVARLDVDGEPLFERALALDGPPLGVDFYGQMRLMKDGRDGALLLFGRKATDRADVSRGIVEGYAVARTGEVTRRFAIATAQAWPRPYGYIDQDLVIAQSAPSADVQVLRYAHDGALRWQQPSVARVPARKDVDFELDPHAPRRLLQMFVDRRDRIWGVLSEGVIGLVQLDASGAVLWHGWTPMPIGDSAASIANDEPVFVGAAIDSRGRIVLASYDTVLRYDPERGDEQRLYPDSFVLPLQAQDMPTAESAGVDAEDRVYFGTAGVFSDDGGASDGLQGMALDRLSEDFARHERFVLDDGGARPLMGHIVGIEVLDGDEAVVSIAGAVEFSGAERFFLTPLLARLRLER